VEERRSAKTRSTPFRPRRSTRFRDHGKLRNSLTENLAAAKETMETLPKVGISMKEVTDKLTNDGVKLFADAFDQLLAAVEKSSQVPRRRRGEPPDSHTSERVGGSRQKQPPTTGVPMAKFAGCGSATRRSGRAPTSQLAGLAGASLTTSWRTNDNLRKRGRRVPNPAGFAHGCRCAPAGRSVMPSQPSQLASSAPVQSDASRCHNLRTLPLATPSRRRLF